MPGGICFGKLRIACVPGVVDHDVVMEAEVAQDRSRRGKEHECDDLLGVLTV